MANFSWTDDQILTVLQMRDDEGRTFKVIADRLKKSRGSVVDLYNRVARETDASDPGNTQNGTMRPDWWQR